MAGQQSNYINNDDEYYEPWTPEFIYYYRHKLTLSEKDSEAQREEIQRRIVADDERRAREPKLTLEEMEEKIKRLEEEKDQHIRSKNKRKYSN